MPVPVPQLVKHLEDSGILAGTGGPGLLGEDVGLLDSRRGELGLLAHE